MVMGIGVLGSEEWLGFLVGLFWSSNQVHYLLSFPFFLCYLLQCSFPTQWLQLILLFNKWEIRLFGLWNFFDDPSSLSCSCQNPIVGIWPGSGKFNLLIMYTRNKRSRVFTDSPESQAPPLRLREIYQY